MCKPRVSRLVDRNFGECRLHEMVRQVGLVEGEAVVSKAPAELAVQFKE